MAQLHLDATVTNGSANVTLPGDVRSEIKPGDYFKLVGIIGVYEIASHSLVSGNTLITLTAPYVGDSGTYPALIHRDFTERGYPLFYEGDLDIPDILRRWALQMDGEVTHAEDVAGEAVAAHVAQPDPHPQYTLQSLLNLGKSTTSPATPITGSLLSGAMLAAGAIVEMGDNANGRYWRWESGLQVCIYRQNLTLSISVSTDLVGAGWYRSASEPVTWPAAFAVPPTASFTGQCDIPPFNIGGVLYQVGTTTARFILYAPASVSSIAVLANMIAIGRWK